MVPAGLRYVESWVDDTNLDRCFQLMETDDPSLFGVWLANWGDLGTFEVVPVITSRQAAARVSATFDEPAAHPISVRPFDRAADAGWVRDLSHGDTRMGRRGELLDVLDQPGLVAERDGVPAGLLAYRYDDDGACELFFIGATEQWSGAGSALVDELLRLLGPGHRVWVVTTNDNVDALRFYQRRGFRLREVRPGAVDDLRRRLKPGIPEIGHHGIPIRDEVELELPS
jgi:ribosomal protein S18 acetylase RimI-like enzyme